MQGFKKITQLNIGLAFVLIILCNKCESAIDHRLNEALRSWCNHSYCKNRTVCEEEGIDFFQNDSGCNYCKFNIFPELFAKRLIGNWKYPIVEFKEPYINLMYRIASPFIDNIGPFHVFEDSDDFFEESWMVWPCYEDENGNEVEFLDYYFGGLESFTFLGFEKILKNN